MENRQGLKHPPIIMPIPSFAENHPAWLRLEDQLRWYDTKSLSNHSYYTRIKFFQILFATMIPLMNLLPPVPAKWVTSILGGSIALLEAMQQLNQYSTLWVTYRSTAERLKHEKFLFLSTAGPYLGLEENDSLIQLAERVEEHVSTEHANWFNETRRITKAKTQ